MKNYKIVVDAMGGDYAPEEVVKGALDALKDDKSLEIVLVGDLEKIDTKLFEEEGLKERAALVDAKDIITNDDIPTVAIKQKKESSLVKAMEIVASDENAGGLVSAG
ncbi:MAG: phosphate acyltransferase, partial [Clostridia bacterium]|nr:phosphate acyltransferase [Clostridia bacterium]